MGGGGGARARICVSVCVCVCSTSADWKVAEAQFYQRESKTSREKHTKSAMFYLMSVHSEEISEQIRQRLDAEMETVTETWYSQTKLLDSE